MAKKIDSLQQLKELSAEDGLDIFILLNGGLRSSKRITYFESDDTWDVYNEIDDSYQEGLTTKQLDEETIVVEALKNGALYRYD